MTDTMIHEKRRSMSRADRTLVTAIVLVASVFPVTILPSATQTPAGSDGQYSGKQGQVIVVKIPEQPAATRVEGRFLDRTIPLFSESRNGERPGYLGLLGIDMQDEPGTHELKVEVQTGEKTKQLSYNVLVMKEKFSVEHLTLPKDKVDLDEKSLARWKAEQEQVKKALAEDSRLKLWQTPFIEPVHGKKSGIFGSVRIMNGQPRNPHNGEDIGAPHGGDGEQRRSRASDCGPLLFRQRHFSRSRARPLLDVFPPVGRAGERRRSGQGRPAHRQSRCDRTRHRPASPLGRQSQRRPRESLRAPRPAV